MSSFAVPDHTRQSHRSPRNGTRVATALLCGPLVFAALALAGPAAAARSCATHGLTVGAGKGASSMTIVSLEVQGFGCAQATGVARQIARDLAAGRTISLDGVADMSISTVSPCGGCAGETQVSLTYPRASISLSLRGAAKLSSGLGGSGFPNVPQIPVPTNPTPDSPGGGSVTL